MSTYFDRMCRLFSLLGSLVLFSLMVLTTADVIGRYLLNRPILGTLELTEFMMVCLVFLGMVYAQTEKSHISVDILASRISRKKFLFLTLFNHVLSIGVLVIIAIKSVSYALEIRMTNDISPILGIPVYPFILVVGLGCAAMIIGIISSSVETLRHLNSL